MLESVLFIYHQWYWCFYLPLIDIFQKADLLKTTVGVGEHHEL